MSDRPRGVGRGSERGVREGTRVKGVTGEEGAGLGGLQGGLGGLRGVGSAFKGV